MNTMLLVYVVINFYFYKINKNSKIILIYYWDIGYTGVMCSECKPDYGKTGKYYCSSCNKELFYLKMGF
jgi:hypothetical protein